MAEKRKIILDVDTGSDDAVAICAALLSEELEVLGICSVGGNVELKNTTDNTLRVVELCKRPDVPVYRGAELPLVSTLEPWSNQAQVLPNKEGTHDQDNAVHTDHLPLPPTTLKAQDKSAAVWLIETLLSAGDGEITLVPVGPITNLALALRADPRIIPKIKEIVLMGGANNVYSPTQAAEFNVWCDPEALEIVLQSGVKITMVSLDATSHACLTWEQAKAIRDIGSPAALFCAELIEHRLRVSEAALAGGKMGVVGAALHDVLAVCAVLHPEVLRTEHVSCHVDVGHGYAYGSTILNRNYKPIDMPKNCWFAHSADTELFFGWLYETLKRAAE